MFQFGNCFQEAAYQAVAGKSSTPVDGMPLAVLHCAMFKPSTGRRRLGLRNDSGFTLIETAVVVAIIGAVAALAGPNIMTMYARYELYQTTTGLYNRLMLARSVALSRNTMIAGTPANLSGAPSQMTFNAVLGTETLPRTVQFVLPLPAQPIGFTSRGLSTVSLATQTIQLQSARDPSLVYTISLAPSGKLTWCNRAVNPCLIQSS